MAGDDGQHASLLDERLRALAAEARKASFFPLICLLERLTPEAVRVGGDGPAVEEALRFRHNPALVFGAGDVEEATIEERPRSVADPHGESREVIEITTNFLGLTGAVSPMPLYLAEEISFEEKGGARRDFLDIFHHRLISLFFRVVNRYSFHLEHYRGPQDVWASRIRGLAGLSLDSNPPARQLPAGRLLRLAPLVARRNRGAFNLQRALTVALSPYLGEEAEVSLRQFTGGRAPLPEEDRCRLGQANCALGQDLITGQSVRDPGSRFTVSIGPLGEEHRRLFAKDGEAWRVLQATLEVANPAPVHHDVELRFDATGMRPFKLSARGTSRLGASTRLTLRREGEVITRKGEGPQPAA
jgi:type VI secretion system protein ImpH